MEGIVSHTTYEYPKAKRSHMAMPTEKKEPEDPQTYTHYHSLYMYSPVQSIQHLYCHQDGECHGHGVQVVKYVTIKVCKVSVVLCALQMMALKQGIHNTLDWYDCETCPSFHHYIACAPLFRWLPSE